MCLSYLAFTLQPCYKHWSISDMSVIRLGLVRDVALMLVTVMLRGFCYLHPIWNWVCRQKYSLCQTERFLGFRSICMASSIVSIATWCISHPAQMLQPRLYDRFKDNIGVCEMWPCGWIDLARSRDQRQALLNTVMNLRVLNSLAGLSFLKGALLRSICYVTEVLYFLRL